MKCLLLTALVTLSLHAFSQSYLIMDNGIVVTTDTSGYVYDFGHYAYPSKVTLKGGQYFVEEGSILATIDENGLLFRKYELVPEKILGKGINYFLSEEGFLYMIDKAGVVKVTESESFKSALNFGGNYFSVATEADKTLVDIYVVTSDGLVKKAEIPSFKTKDIVAYGGTYFMTNRGIIFTIADSGVVASKETHRVGLLQKRGGNYFIDSSGFFFSVTQTGNLLAPALPASLRVNAIQRLGSNYFIDQQGRLFVVEKNGQVYERVMRDNDFRQAKVISL
jgi:hypothetical protein